MGRYKLLGCKIMEREIASVVYSCKNVIDVTLIRQKLHDRPDNLRKVLQNEIDQLESNEHKYSNDTKENDFDANNGSVFSYFSIIFVFNLLN